MCVECAQAYSNSLVDYHLILDLLPSFARAYFAGRVPATLSYGQAAILLSLGLQQQELSAVEAALELPASQVRKDAICLSNNSRLSPSGLSLSLTDLCAMQHCVCSALTSSKETDFDMRCYAPSCMTHVPAFGREV